MEPEDGLLPPLPKPGVGILIGGLGGTQLSYSLVGNSARYYASGGRVDVVAFLQNAGRPHEVPRFARFSIADAYDYRGVAVATDLATADALRRMPGPSSRFFYVWDLEWVRGTGLPYELLAELYRLPLIARSESHRAAIEDAWNTRVVAVVPDFDIDPLIKTLSKESQNGKADDNRIGPG